MRSAAACLGGAVALALAVLLTACGGTEAGSRPPTPTPTVAPSPTPRAAPEAKVEAGAAVGGPTTAPQPREAQVTQVGPRDARAVSLTFDTGVAAGHTTEILDTLKEHSIRATFGITGEWAITNPNLLKRIVQEGHALINHSWSHPSFTGEDTETPPLSADQIRDELAKTDGKIEEIAGVSTKPYFRPPYGDYDSRVNAIAWEAGYEHNVLWTIDGMGWDGRSAGSVARVTLAKAFPGAIFLYHVDNSQEYKALAEIIEGLTAAGFAMVTIPELLGHQPLPTATATATPTPTPAAAPTPSPSPTNEESPPPPSSPAPPPPPPPAPSSLSQPPSLTPPPLPPPAPVPTAAPTATPAPLPTPAFTRLAFDDFESGGMEGGSGWLGPWQPPVSGVTDSDAPYAGRWHLAPSSAALVSRAADLSAYENVHLRFWARLSSFEQPDWAFVLIGNDEVQWQVAKQFTEAESDGVYHLYDIDLSGIAMSHSFRVGFYTSLGPLSGQWHVDDVEFATPAP